MRIVNPNYVKVSPIPPAIATKLQAVLLALATSPAPTFEEIRAQLTPAQQLIATDGMIAQAAGDAGLTVLHE